MFENWIVNDGDENRENLEQSRYYDLITRDGKFVPETVFLAEKYAKRQFTRMNVQRKH